jgi:hypothetical protein
LLHCGDTGLKFGHFNPIISSPDRRQNIRPLPLATLKPAGANLWNDLQDS